MRRIDTERTHHSITNLLPTSWVTCVQELNLPSQSCTFYLHNQRSVKRIKTESTYISFTNLLATSLTIYVSLPILPHPSNPQYTDKWTKFAAHRYYSRPSFYPQSLINIMDNVFIGTEPPATPFAHSIPEDLTTCQPIRTESTNVFIMSILPAS